MADAKKADKPKSPQGGKAPQGAKQPKQGKGQAPAAPAAPATRARVTGEHREVADDAATRRDGCQPPRVLGATERAPEAAEEPQERSPAQTGQERPGLYRGRVVRVVRRDLPDGVIRARR